MRPASAGVSPEEVRAFTEQVLRTGMTLFDVLSILVEGMDEEAFPGESPGEVLVEMLAGSIQPAADAAGPETVTRATALVGAVLDRAMADMREAARLAGEQERRPA